MRKVSAAALACAALGAALVTNPGVSLAGFSAQLSDSGNTFSAATMQLQESSGTNACYSTGSGSGGSVSNTNSATCGINAMLSSLGAVAPGTPVSVTITVTNVGTMAATVDSLTFGQCTTTTAPTGPVGSGLDGFCNKVDVTLSSSANPGMCVYPASRLSACPAMPTSIGTLADDGGSTFDQASLVPLPALASGASCTYTFTAMLDPSVTNADQGLVAAQQAIWNQA